jgi:hypothetical protein
MLNINAIFIITFVFGSLWGVICIYLLRAWEERDFLERSKSTPSDNP